MEATALSQQASPIPLSVSGSPTTQSGPPQFWEVFHFKTGWIWIWISSDVEMGS